MKTTQILTSIAIAIATITLPSINGRAQAQQTCPKAGEFRMFAQIVAQAEIFNGCDVTTEVSFMMIGGGDHSYAFHDLKGLTIFRVMPLGQPASFSQLGTLEAFPIAIPNDKADPIFMAKNGDTLRLRGYMDYKTYEGRSVGIISTVFRAQSIEIVKDKK